MRERRFRHLPVVAHGRLVGIVSDRDVAGADARTIAQVMRTLVISVTPDTPVEVAAHLMLDNKIGALPVLGAGSADLVGIVSQTDLFEVLARLLGGEGPSTRLELRLADGPSQLATLTAVAAHQQVPITSLVMVPTRYHTGPGRVIVLRIGTMQFRPFVTALCEAGIAVDAPHALELPSPTCA